MLQSTFQTRQLIDPNLYWFAIPNIGSLLKGLSQVAAVDLVIRHSFVHEDVLLFWYAAFSYGRVLRVWLGVVREVQLQETMGGCTLEL
ncbi:hypothetical protein RHGRI_011237 [Rhododendron griersonianum]|uniref:Uncharacterized protein n=1 Tax=Rhododendron griersonianum TaxID=479676 RepID=A0AAV6KL40_9ERIC|nr:hypothetical protein RHGRI_011237 [Rhododendron griersonianum]